MSEFKVILTNAGVAAFAQATSTSTTVDFSNFAVGDSNGSYYTPTPDLTTLKNERWRGDVLDIKPVPGKSKIEVTTVIPATVGGWYIREMAILSADGIMLAIGKVPESFKPDPLSGSSKDLSIKAVFEVSNASVVNMVIDPNNVIANKKYVDDKVSDLEQRAGTAIGVVDERVTQHLAQYPLDLGLKANKQQESWKSLPLVNGWGNMGGGLKPLAYFKDEFDFVHVNGDISGGVTTSNTVVATLPVGYRPLENKYIAMFNSDGAETMVTAYIWIDTNGNIMILKSEYNNHISITTNFKVV